MSGVVGWACPKHDKSGVGDDGCPQCRHDAHERVQQFVNLFNQCEGCTVKAGRIRFLEHLLADEKKNGDAAYAKALQESNEAIDLLARVKRLLPADWAAEHERIDVVLEKAWRS